MALKILRLKKVLGNTGDSRSGFYLKIQNSLFTPPVSLGARSVGWPEYEVDAINAARIAGKSDDEIRILVKELLAARQGVSLDYPPRRAAK